jgi:hypothetical protein
MANTTSGVQIKGIKEVVRSLERFGTQAADLKAAFFAIGSMVVAEARSLINTRSGALAASVKASKTKNKSAIRAGSTRVPYAGVIEYGGYHGIVGQHYLAGGIENKQGETLEAISLELNSLIRKNGLT